MSNKILVLGATGNIGSHLIKTLVNQGEVVKAASRKGTSLPGAESVVFDFSDKSTIESAFAEVDRAFIMVPTGIIDVVSLITPVFKAAFKQGVKVVFQSVLGVDADDNIPYRQLELKLINSGLPYVILRPNWFADNFHTFWSVGVQHGEVAVPAANGASSFIDTRDIAESAAAALTSDKFDKQAFNLTGPTAFTYAEALLKLSHVIGKTVSYQAIDDDTFVSILNGAGVPVDYARFLASIFYPVREGWTSVVTNDVETLTGHKARTLDTYLQDNLNKLKP